MNDAHLHLILNHIPFGTLVIGLVALIASMIRRSSDLRGFASCLFIVTGIFAWIAVQTGEKAEAVVKTLGVGPEVEGLINTHAGAADWALRSGLLLACLAIAMEIAILKKPTWVKPLKWLLLIFAIHGTTVFAFTSLQGGKIRHSEVR